MIQKRIPNIIKAGKIRHKRKIKGTGKWKDKI